MTEPPYIRDEDKEEYRRFCAHHCRTYGRPLPDEIWHYTSAEGLIGILNTGKLFSTQVTCLNDNLEQRYFGDLILKAVREEALRNTDQHRGIMLRVADAALSARDFASAWHLVICLSEAEDDLGQWRGYGGGECGYAIGFRSTNLMTALQQHRPNALLAPMLYEEETQAFMIAEVMRMAEVYFLAGIKRGYSDIERWAREFLFAFAWELDVFASMTKHPKFKGEMERRIVTSLLDGEHKDLEFRQKRTLLARHLPIKLTIDCAGVPKLPISRIYVGPSPAQAVTRVSVGDLLLKHGYQGVVVEISKVPYRIP